LTIDDGDIVTVDVGAVDQGCREGVAYAAGYRFGVFPELAGSRQVDEQVGAVTVDVDPAVWVNFYGDDAIADSGCTGFSPDSIRVLGCEFGTVSGDKYIRWHGTTFLITTMNVVEQMRNYSKVWLLILYLVQKR